MFRTFSTWCFHGTGVLFESWNFLFRQLFLLICLGLLGIILLTRFVLNSISCFESSFEKSRKSPSKMARIQDGGCPCIMTLMQARSYFSWLVAWNDGMATHSSTHSKFLKETLVHGVMVYVSCYVLEKPALQLQWFLSSVLLHDSQQAFKTMIPCKRTTPWFPVCV